MPGITLTVSGEPDEILARRLATQLSDLTCRLLKKELSRTTATVRYVAKEHWFISGTSLAEQRKNAFRLEVTITHGTNTKEEKAAYHQAAFALLSELIGDLHCHSNIHVVDCRASAYGYGGITQECRLQHPVSSSTGRSTEVALATQR